MFDRFEGAAGGCNRVLTKVMKEWGMALGVFAKIRASSTWMEDTTGRAASEKG